MGKDIIYSESQGVFSNTRNYIVNPDEPKRLFVSEGYGSGQSKSLSPRQKSREKVSKRIWIQNLKQTLGQIFLPHGYPDSVSSDYINFQIWDTVQVDIHHQLTAKQINLSN